MTFYFLDHSGFAVDTGRRWLIFDYFTDKPKGKGLSEGVINPLELGGKPVVVFSSHSHHDHFNPIIFSWRGKVSEIQYVLSDDISTSEEALFVSPGQRYERNGVTIETLNSTDEGVAFLVRTDGFTIYHAGDLNHWHWEGEPHWYNLQMAERYHTEMAKLRGKVIDLAFVPVDPRLGEAFWFGLAGLMETAKVGCAVPMHFWGDFSVMDRLKECGPLSPCLDRVVYLTKRGQQGTCGKWKASDD